LAISVIVSMFTAITVTRTFLRATQQFWLRGTNVDAQPRIRWLFGLHAGEDVRPVGSPRPTVSAPR
ncbi:MAG: hypothetical protein K6T71_00515, partial [Candidatus Bipolaricaulota bacterium]|nr:hypothetical protein [Candidatus Bipolaricaulota bacterium]